MNGSSAVTSSSAATVWEFVNNAVLAVAFLGTAFLAWRRKSTSSSAPVNTNIPNNNSNGTTKASSASNTNNNTPTPPAHAETTVVRAFYSLIQWTSVVRAVWLLWMSTINSGRWTPTAVSVSSSNSSSGTDAKWIRVMISQVLLTAGSTLLFSIFILILVYWADILKKYFYPGLRRVRPLTTFTQLVAVIVSLQLLSVILFLCNWYTSEGLLLWNAVLLAIVSLICVVQITVFSHRFRTVLRTLGAINQVPTESQVKRIVWITVTGNLFFGVRAILECMLVAVLVTYWQSHGTVQYVFSHALWDFYSMLKLWSEWAILALMLYILQSRFANTTAAAAGSGSGGSSTANGKVHEHHQGATTEEQRPLNV